MRPWLLLSLAALGAAAYFFLAGPRLTERQPAWVTAPVDRGPIRAAVTATGTVNPVTTVQVGTYVSGPIQGIFADFNTPVTRGQLLAKIDPRPFQVKVDEAAADLANARAKLVKDRADAALKKVTLKRTRDLRQQGIVAASDFDLAESQDRQAAAQVALDEADIESAEAKLHEAEVNLAYTDITSPLNGVVVSRTVDVGQTVAASFQTPTLFLVAEDLTKMQVATSVSESDIGGVAADQEATFTVDAYPGSPFHGRVAQVRNAPATVQNVVTYDVVINVDNTELRLKPGMTANVTIVTAMRTEALRVPLGALRFRPPAHAGASGAAAAAEGADARSPHVWVLGADGTPRQVPIETGISDDRFVEVTGGLAEGDRLIVAVERAETAGPPGQAPSFASPMRRTH